MISTFQPQSILLQKYIECFYVFDSESHAKFSYLAFPHYNNGLSFFKGVKIQRNDYHIAISESAELNTHVEILGKYVNPLLLQYNGRVQEISIIFKPLGLNRFFRENYNSIAPNFSQEYKNKTWQNQGEELFDRPNQILKLEEFLISQFQDDNEIVSIEQSLPYFNNNDELYSVAEIAAMLRYNLKTFQRHFTKHLGCSPIEYRRILRFRNSLESKLQANDLKSLTDITFENNYFDQSYFIKEFKRLTTHNPKNFFKVVSKLDGDKIIWEIL